MRAVLENPAHCRRGPGISRRVAARRPGAARMGSAGDRGLTYRRSLRTQGPIATGARDKQRKMTQSLSNNIRHGAAMSAIVLTPGVPAFAGTTPYFAAAASG